MFVFFIRACGGVSVECPFLKCCKLSDINNVWKWLSDLAQCHHNTSPSRTAVEVERRLDFITLHPHSTAVQFNQRYQSGLCCFSLCSINSTVKKLEPLQVIVTLRQKSVILLLVCSCWIIMCSMVFRAFPHRDEDTNRTYWTVVFLNHHSVAARTNHYIKLRLNNLAFPCLIFFCSKWTHNASWMSRWTPDKCN